MARPTKMTEQTLKDLRAAFLFGATKEEASAYANISKVTLYNYIDKHPEFLNEIEAWQNDPILRAKRKVVMELDKDTKNAQWYLERKRKDEFSIKTEVEGDISLSIVDKILAGYELKEGSDDRKTDGSVDRPSQDQA